MVRVFLLNDHEVVRRGRTSQIAETTLRKVVGLHTPTSSCSRPTGSTSRSKFTNDKPLLLLTPGSSSVRPTTDHPSSIQVPLATWTAAWFVDRPPGAVTLYVTDDNRGRLLVAAAKKAHPRIDDGLVRIVHARFSRKAVDAQMSRIMPAAGLDPAVYATSANPDGSGITVTVAKDKVAAEKARLTALITATTGIPVTVTAGRPSPGRRGDGAYLQDPADGSNGGFSARQSRWMGPGSVSGRLQSRAWYSVGGSNVGIGGA